jgi:hypothetical protein
MLFPFWNIDNNKNLIMFLKKEKGKGKKEINKLELFCY